MTKEIEEIMTCLHCGNKAAQKQIARYDQDVSLGIWAGGEEILTDNYVFLFECKTCKGLSLKTIYSETVDSSGYINFDGMNSLYPISKEFPENMPFNIVKSYKEARKVKRISPVAFSILIRKSLEELCKDRKAKGKTLKGKIEYLAKNNILPSSFIKMVNSIRTFGNIGAHEIEVDLTEEQVDILDDFFIALIEYVYIAPNKMKKLQDSLKKKGS